MSPWRLMLCLSLLLPSLGFAQAPDEWTPYTPPEAELPPPLVPASPLPPSAPPPPPRASAEEPPKGEIIPRDLAAERAESTQTALRLLVTPWSGAITGAVGLILGVVPTAIIALPFCSGTNSIDEKPRCAIAFGTGLAVSYSMGVTLGVVFAGKLLEGRGDGVLTFLGALAGAAVGSGIGIASQSTEALILGMAIGPLLGAVTGYELSHTQRTQPARPGLQARSGFRVVPMAGATPGGGILAGLAGRF